MITVKSVRKITCEPTPVYDATVPQYHNYALGNGVVVHNTAKYSRFKEYQEVLKLKGKPLNSARSTELRMANNESIRNMLVAIGFNPVINEKTRKSTTRVNHIYLLSDSDPDGSHINILGLTALWKAIPQIFHEHRVHVIIAPLYSAHYKGKQYFADTLAQIREKLPKEAPSKVITRLKGWGEATVDELRQIAFDPKTRKAYVIQAPDTHSEESNFYALVGDNPDARKAILGV